MAVERRNIEFVQDRTLAEDARRGGRPAFDEVARRHLIAAWRFALAVARGPVAAGAAVQGAFASTLAGPGDLVRLDDERLRLTLLRATRQSALAETRPSADRAAWTHTLPADPRAAAVRLAFDELPERWRSVLWLGDIEGCSNEDTARVLELAPPAVTSLAERARLGLREQVLETSTPPNSPAACRRSVDRLTGYVTGTLAARDETRVRAHLDGCSQCRDRLALLDDVLPLLQQALLPISDALLTQTAARWSEALVRDSGPLSITLPGGKPMPVWAQRAFAGGVAAAVTLGITAATIFASRNRGGSGDDARPTVATQERAFGEPGLDDLVLDGSGFPSAPVATARASSLPRNDDDVAAPLPDGSAHGPGTPDLNPPSIVPPSIVPPSADDPPSSGSSGGSSVTVNLGVVGVTVGESCTGAQVFGTALGCAPPASTAPVTVTAPESAALPTLAAG
ncbi:MAG: zf-HC2 domain-containing protein [Microthrixaceae bacterium]